jgi:hypothetical protein
LQQLQRAVEEERGARALAEAAASAAKSQGSAAYAELEQVQKNVLYMICEIWYVICEI